MHSIMLGFNYWVGAGYLAVPIILGFVLRARGVVIGLVLRLLLDLAVARLNALPLGLAMSAAAGCLGWIVSGLLARARRVPVD
jgi:hypothetical protein